MNWMLFDGAKSVAAFMLLYHWFPKWWQNHEYIKFIAGMIIVFAELFEYSIKTGKAIDLAEVVWFPIAGISAVLLAHGYDWINKERQQDKLDAKPPASIN